MAKRVQDTLAQNPQCYDVFFSIWGHFKGANAPVWAPISPTIKKVGNVATPWSAASNSERSRCLSLFAEVTGINNLPSATNKAADARKELFW